MRNMEGKKINTVLDINELLASVDTGRKKGKSGFIIRSWMLCREGIPHFGEIQGSPSLEEGKLKLRIRMQVSFGWVATCQSLLLLKQYREITLN